MLNALHGTNESITILPSTSAQTVCDFVESNFQSPAILDGMMKGDCFKSTTTTSKQTPTTATVGPSLYPIKNIQSGDAIHTSSTSNPKSIQPSNVRPIQKRPVPIIMAKSTNGNYTTSKPEWHKDQPSNSILRNGYTISILDDTLKFKNVKKTSNKTIQLAPTGSSSLEPPTITKSSEDSGQSKNISQTTTSKNVDSAKKIQSKKPRKIKSVNKLESSKNTTIDSTIYNLPSVSIPIENNEQKPVESEKRKYNVKNKSKKSLEKVVSVQPSQQSPEPSMSINEINNQSNHQNKKRTIESSLNDGLSIKNFELLDYFVYEYLNKRGFSASAKEMQSETKISRPKDINGDNVLAEWWLIFWEMYTSSSIDKQGHINNNDLLSKQAHKVDPILDDSFLDELKGTKKLKLSAESETSKSKSIGHIESTQLTTQVSKMNHQSLINPTSMSIMKASNQDYSHKLTNSFHLLSNDPLYTVALNSLGYSHQNIDSLSLETKEKVIGLTNLLNEELRYRGRWFEMISLLSSLEGRPQPTSDLLTEFQNIQNQHALIQAKIKLICDPPPSNPNPAGHMSSFKPLPLLSTQDSIQNKIASTRSIEFHQGLNLHSSAIPCTSHESQSYRNLPSSNSISSSIMKTTGNCSMTNQSANLSTQNMGKIISDNVFQPLVMSPSELSSTSTTATVTPADAMDFLLNDPSYLNLEEWSTSFASGSQSEQSSSTLIASNSTSLMMENALSHSIPTDTNNSKTLTNSNELNIKNEVDLFPDLSLENFSNAQNINVVEDISSLISEKLTGPTFNKSNQLDLSEEAMRELVNSLDSWLASTNSSSDKSPDVGGSVVDFQQLFESCSSSNSSNMNISDSSPFLKSDAPSNKLSDAQISSKAMYKVVARADFGNLITSISFDPTGSIIACAGLHRDLLIYDVRSIMYDPFERDYSDHTQNSLSPLPFISKMVGHTDAITKVKFLVESDVFFVLENAINNCHLPVLMASASLDHSVCIWDMTSGIRSVQNLTNSGMPGVHVPVTKVCMMKPVVCMDFCPFIFPPHLRTGANWNILCLSSDSEGVLKLWNAFSGEIIWGLQLSLDHNKSNGTNCPIKFKPVSKLTHDVCETSSIFTIIAAARRNTLFIIQLQLGWKVLEAKGNKLSTMQTHHVNEITSLVWSSGGEYLLSISSDMIVIWDATNIMKFSSTSPPLRVISQLKSNANFSSAKFLETNDDHTKRKSSDSKQLISVIFCEGQNLCLWETLCSAGLDGSYGSGIVQGNVSTLLCHNYDAIFSLSVLPPGLSDGTVIGCGGGNMLNILKC